MSAAAGKGERTGKAGSDRAGGRIAGKAKWTVMVYMAGDNNLDGTALRDIEEMAQVGSTKDVNVLVQLDRLEDKKTRRFRITKGGGYDRDCVETFGETNTGDPKILEDFLAWSVERYPAERYFLILWNHGSGWWEESRSRSGAAAGADALGNRELKDVLAAAGTADRRSHGAAGNDTEAAKQGHPAEDPLAVSAHTSHSAATIQDKQTVGSSLLPGRDRGPSPRVSLFRHKADIPAPTTHRSICYDDTSGGDALDNRELKDVLASACTAIGKKIDILGMDACLMTMVEVAWQLRDAVEILVGSEIEEPNDGWPYAEILSFLTAKPKSKTHVVAKGVVKQYVASYRDQGETVTQSAINAAATEAIIRALIPLAAELLVDLDKNRKLIQWAWVRAPKFYDDNYLDLYAFARKLRTKSKDQDRIREKADALLTALKTGNQQAILRQGRLGKEVAGTKGLSIYFPAEYINPAYRRLDFAIDAQCAVFLERYLR
jgi:hypothetical protein